jgi:hypothetical protein
VQPGNLTRLGPAQFQPRAHPSRSGAADTARTSPAPGPVARSAPSTDSQNRRGSRFPRPAATHAARPARPASAIHDRSRTVLPLPAGADTTVTRAGPRAVRTRPDGQPPRLGHGHPRPRNAIPPEIHSVSHLTNLGMRYTVNSADPTPADKC